MTSTPLTTAAADPTSSCSGCADDRRARLLSRRTLLKGGAGAAATFAVSEHLTARYAAAAAPTGADTLVVMVLRGGFDGLSAVVPAADPAYYALRPGIGIPQASLLPLDSRFGLHPALAALKPFWDNGTFGVVHAAGLTNPNRSHFAAMEEIENAAPGSSIRTGWLDRTLALDSTAPASAPFKGTTIGGRAPRSTAGPQPDLTMRSLQDFSLSGTSTAQERATWTTALTALHSGATSAVADPARSTLNALSSVATLAAETYLPGGGAVYPDTDLGRAFRDAAHLIRSPHQVDVLTIDEGDWDMHAGLGTVGAGWMHDKLTELGATLAAFATDLGPTMDRVTVVTMSEFGRRTAENASGGVDHGWGNAMLLLGGGVAGGVVHGDFRGLDTTQLTEGDVTATTDFRWVLADLLVNRCGATLDEARAVFPGWNGARLGVSRPRG
jgi:uncharacterized protein (DUF1501 family)